jgi:hypothetical protein
MASSLTRRPRVRPRPRAEGIPDLNARRADIAAVARAIADYAPAYQALDNLQRSMSSLVPVGDQKTGVIAEFFARLYAHWRFKGCRSRYGHPSHPSIDIEVTPPGRRPLNIQVKAVSAFAQKSRISPVKTGWHELWLMRLDQRFYPIGFWVLTRDQARWRRSKTSLTMPVRGAPQSGSQCLWGAEDRYSELVECLTEYSEELAVCAPAGAGIEKPWRAR